MVDYLIPICGFLALIGTVGCLIALIIAKVKKKPIKPFVGALLVNFMIFSLAIGYTAKYGPIEKKDTVSSTASKPISDSSQAAEKSSQPAKSDSRGESASSNVPAPAAPVSPSNSAQEQPKTDEKQSVVRHDGPGPNGETIKGNINSKGEKIYHVPGGQFYDKTVPEAWFFTEADARAAGYRASRR